MPVRSNIVGIEARSAGEGARRPIILRTRDSDRILSRARARQAVAAEGAPGVGKTEAPRHCRVLGRSYPAQCYEGIAASAALYEGTIRARCWRSARPAKRASDIYGETFLIERPMLAPCARRISTVLLIDESTAADQEFEASCSNSSRLPDFHSSAARCARAGTSVVRADVEPDARTCTRRCGAAASITGSTIRPRSAKRASSDAGLSVAESTARAVVAAVAGCGASRSQGRGPEAVDWAEAATLLHQGGARWPDAFKRSIGVALKDEEDLHFISPRLDA